MTDEEIASLICRRRRQLLVHSILYYKMNKTLVDDSTWSHWAVELEQLQKNYPKIASKQVFARPFKHFDHSTGFNLPLKNDWGVRKAHQLLAYSEKMKGE